LFGNHDEDDDGDNVVEAEKRNGMHDSIAFIPCHKGMKLAGVVVVVFFSCRFEVKMKT
jgi:hypothetical protein